MSDSRRLYETIKIKIRADQLAAVDADADRRYPERHGPSLQRRGRNPAFRDVLDFWMAHYDLFLSWLTTNR